MNFITGINLGAGIGMMIMMYWNLKNKNYTWAFVDFTLGIINIGLVFV